jgi:hypothetical protein
MARVAHRRAHALGLGGRALHQQPRGVTHRIAPQRHRSGRKIKPLLPGGQKAAYETIALLSDDQTRR